MSYQQQSQLPRSSTLTQTPDEMYTSPPIQYTNVRSETKQIYPNLPNQPTQYENYQTETKAYVNPIQQQSSGQPVQYENYRTETKSYTNPPQTYNQGQPQGSNYRSYSKSYTTPPQTYGYPNVNNLPMDQVQTNAPITSYTNTGLPVDHIDFGSNYRNNYSQDPYNRGVGGQVDSAGRNLRGAIGSFGHAIGNIGHAIFNAVDRFSDDVGGNNMRRAEKKAKKGEATITTTTTQVNQVGPS